MPNHRAFATVYFVAMLFAIPGSSPLVRGADNDPVKVAGILIEKSDNSITLKGDGDEEPTKYLIGDGADKKLTDSLKMIFGAGRVQITYKKDGDSRKLVSIKRQVLKASGTVTGTVVKVYNDFWVEVKPKTGVADAYAPSGTNYKNKEFMDQLKGLQKGDSVTITFTTDFERHRIETLRKNSMKKND